MKIVKITPQAVFGLLKPRLSPSENIFIMGGAIRAWYSGVEVSPDIDIFSNSEQALEDFRLKNNLNVKKISDYAITCDLKIGYYKKDVQLIKHLYSDNIVDFFDSFDFTLCQFAWTEDGIFATEEAIESVNKRILKVHKLNNNNISDSFRRAFKYAKKGYDINKDTLKELQSKMIEFGANNAQQYSPPPEDLLNLEPVIEVLEDD